jgi:hypothetical protein
MGFASEDQSSATNSSTSNASTSNAQKESAAIKRLMEEVRCEDIRTSSPTGYNRQHNRHNR